MYELFGLFGFLMVLAAPFYFIVIPILLFRLMGRVRTLEEGHTVSAPVTPSPMQQKPRTTPVRAEEPAASLARKVEGKIAPPRPAKTLSLEERVGGKLFQWIGIGALVIALLFFLRWSFENGLIGPVGRTLLGYVFSAGAIALGDRLRSKYGIWSLTFTGGGALGSYIVTSIGLHVYQLFPQPIAMGIFVLTTFVVCLLSGFHASIPLAVFGIVGGFLTPMLVGGDGAMIPLLSYILILDLGILGLAHVRQWRWLNIFGLLGTALYEFVAMFDGTFTRPYALAFIAAFFAIYVLVPYVYNLLKQQKSSATDIMILVGNALFHFGFILGWLDETPGLREQYDAIVSLGFAVIFLLFASEVYRRNRRDTPLVIGSLGITIFFATLMVPLQFGGAWVPLTWSIEGAFLLWTALTLRDVRIQRFGWIVMCLAYVWYFMAPVTFIDAVGTLRERPLLHLPSGMYIFVLWMALLAVYGTFGFGRDDRREQRVVPFILVGMIVLAVSLCSTMFSCELSLYSTAFKCRTSLTNLQALTEAVALIGGGYFILWRAFKQWARFSDEERHQFAVIGIGLQLVTLAYFSREFTKAILTGSLFAGMMQPYQVINVGLSILWALYGTAALIIGIAKHWKPLRIFSLILLLIAIAKLTLIDFFGLGTGPRVIGFTVLGALLVGASFLYQTKKEAVKSILFSPSK